MHPRWHEQSAKEVRKTHQFINAVIADCVTISENADIWTRGIDNVARATFLMDRIIGGVGLHGRSFIPLLASVACAIPGIMATRVVYNRQQRLATILIIR